MNSRRKYFVFLVAACVVGILGALWMVFFKTETPVHHIEEPYSHYLSYKDYVFGTGTVVPGSDEINIVSPMERRIEAVLVKEGEKVKKEEPLLELAKKDLLAGLAVKKASLEKAKKEFKKLYDLPRREDLLAQEASVREAEVVYKEAERQKELADELFREHAISEGELKEKNYQADLEKARFDYARAQLEKIKAGAWNHDLDLALAEIEYQKTLINVDEENISETVIRSPIDGTVLKVNVHPGETALVSSDRPLMVLGNVENCHVEVAVDENEVSRIAPHVDAVGFFRERNAPPISLSFVRIEPMMVPKKNFSGTANERVDTRVLMVVYQFNSPLKCPYIGQQMDVFIPHAPENKPAHE